MPLNNPSLAVSITTGTYTGNNAANRAIPHGLTGIPKLVIIMQDPGGDAGGETGYQLYPAYARIFYRAGGANSSLAVTAMDATSFYVGNATTYAQSANNNPVVFTWYAYG